MNRKRQKQIDGMAVDLLLETGLYNSAPIDVKAVARKLGIALLPYAFGDEIAGVLMYDGQKTTIGYSETNYSTRQRFTIAHELGHYTLGHQREGMFVDSADKYYSILYRDAKSSTGEYLQEREANAFAAALLMPADLLNEVIRNLQSTLNLNDPDLDIIKVLSDKFEVSYQAMAFRLTNLDLLW